MGSYPDVAAAAAIICLPRQFTSRSSRTSPFGSTDLALVFPATLPFTAPSVADRGSGLEQFSRLSVPADTFVLALPLSRQPYVVALGVIGRVSLDRYGHRGNHRSFPHDMQ